MKNLSYLILCVDDVLVISKQHLHKVIQIKNNFMKEFEMIDGGELFFFLGLHIERNYFSLKIVQIQYLTNFLRKFSMDIVILHKLLWNTS